MIGGKPLLIEQKSCTVNSIKELIHAIDIYCAQKNCTKGHLVNSLFIALLTGDITIERDLNRKLRSVAGVTDDVNSLYKLELFDREGELLNPSSLDIDYEY